MTPQILVLDTRDDRQEVQRLLSALAPKDRVKFLIWACQRVPQGRGRLPVPQVSGMRETCDLAYRCDRADERLTRMVYMDCLALFANFELDAAKTAIALERWVRLGAVRASEEAKW